MVKIADIINTSCKIMADGVPNPRLEAELLVCHVLKKDRVYIAVHKNDAINSAYAEEILKVSELRAKGMPFAYITGKKEFMSLDFCVNPGVLIPRPETEELVTLVIDICKNKKDLKILDLCTGSGAIAISCAYYIPGAICHGVDISDVALKTAKKNAHNLGVELRTEFIKHDVLDSGWNFGQYDVVVSNPPYIETDTIKTLDNTVKSFEPQLALDGGTDGLMFYKKIIDNADLYLKQNGMILFEIGYNQSKDVTDIMKDKFYDIKTFKDYSKNDRIVCGILK